MTESRLERLAPLSGVATVIFMVVGSVLFGFYEYLPAADSLVELGNAHATRITAASYIGFLSAVTMLWFSGSLFEYLRQREGAGGRLSMIAFGGGLGTSVAIAAGFAIMLSFAARAGSAAGIDQAEAIILYDLYGNILGGMTAITLSLLIAATAVLSLRENIFPAWFGYASIIIALGLLTPAAYLVLFVALVWLIYVSIVLYR